MMSSASINSFSLYHHNPTNRWQRQTACTLIKPLPIFQTHVHNSLKICPIQAHNHKFHIPNSIIARSFQPKKQISKFFSEKIVLVLVGSFIFMGMGVCLNTRPVLSQPLQENSHSENIEQEKETQNAKTEEVVQENSHSENIEQKREPQNGKTEEVVQENSHSENIEQERETKNGKTEEDEEEMYVKLLEGNPRNVDALKGVFYGKMKRGKTKEAVEYVERLIEIEPKEVEWRLLQALCYEMLGQFSKAKRLFKEILERRPLLIRALHGLAMVMHKNFEGPAVFEMLNKALDIARREKRVTEERNIRILIAQMHVVKGELQDALEKFQQLVSDNPRDFRPYLCQGIIYSLLDKEKEAEELFTTYRNLVPDEFPQRGFLDDAVFAAKTEARQKSKEKVQN